MDKGMFAFVSFILLVITLIPASDSWSQKADPTIVDFKLQPLYRAAMLTWKTKSQFKAGSSVQILRADTFEEGPYQEVAIVPLTPDKNSYEYVDKSMGSESKYYYKLVIKETGESFGPLPTRPYFSPPATRLQPPFRSESSV